MATTRYTIRDDDRYTVVVGWADDLETFFAAVYRSPDGEEPLLAVGTSPREIRAISHLADAISGYASVDAATVSALRHDAAPDDVQ
jgi:hypothetical protein